MKESKKSTKKTQKSTKASGPLKIVKNNNSFKRAMVQMDIKKGDKIKVVFDNGSKFIVESV